MGPIHLNWCQIKSKWSMQTRYWCFLCCTRVYILHSTFDLSARNNPFFWIGIKLKMLPSWQHWSSCLKELSVEGLAFAAAGLWWIIARGEKDKWGLTKSRRPKVSLARGERCTPRGHKHTELQLKSPLINNERENTHLWKAHTSIHENTCSTHRAWGGDVKATGLLYKRILCSITAKHTHTQTYSIHTQKCTHT